MAQPHKTCPKCGQPAVLTMKQCGRCGHTYRTDFAAAPSGNSCAQCGKTFNLLTKHLLDPSTGLCRNCLEVQQRRYALRTEQFRTAFNKAVTDSKGELTDPFMNQLRLTAQNLGIHFDEAFASV